MSRMKLANDEVITIEDGFVLGRCQIITDDIVTTWNKLTDDNLSLIQILNDDTDSDYVVAEYSDCTCDAPITVAKSDDKYLVTFPIRQKSEIEILRAKIAKIESEQAEQNNAIDSLTDAALTE